MYIRFSILNSLTNNGYQTLDAIIEVAERGREKEAVVDPSVEEKAKKFGYISNPNMTPSAYLEGLYKAVSSLDHESLIPKALQVTYGTSLFAFPSKLDIEGTLIKMKAFSVKQVIYLFYCSFEDWLDEELLDHRFKPDTIKCLVECLQVIAGRINEPVISTTSCASSKVEETSTEEGREKAERFLGQLLGCAVANGNLPVTRLLLEFDFDIHQVNMFEGETPFVIAARKGRLDLIDSIVDKFIKTKRMIPAADIEKAIKQASAKGFVDMTTYLGQLLVDQSKSKQEVEA